MSQFRIYGHANYLRERTRLISDAVHSAAVAGLAIPEEKRFHRFFPLEDGYFFTPDDRSEAYLIIECVLFEGRSMETKKAFYRELLQRLGADCGIAAQDIEFTFIETPRHDWFIRGVPGDELSLNYTVNR